ncbi:MAG: bacteriocin [Flavobacteriaceae bacterium]|nr:bacteriocin [Flavobacteriaceae bacterium]
MGNLKEYGIQEMSAKEMNSVEGGWWITISGGWFNWVNLYDERTGLPHLIA